MSGDVSLDDSQLNWKSIDWWQKPNQNKQTNKEPKSFSILPGSSVWEVGEIRMVQVSKEEMWRSGDR